MSLTLDTIIANAKDQKIEYRNISELIKLHLNTLELPPWFKGSDNCNCVGCKVARLRDGKDEFITVWGSHNDEMHHALRPTYQWFTEIPMETIKTQKARGVRAIAQGHFALVGVNEDKADTYLIPHQLGYLEEKYGHRKFLKKMFARPCPLRPRHGFVESREVKNLEEAVAVWKEAILEDPDAELLLMERLPGEYSAVATNRGVSWGKGHDAVTGGDSVKFIVTVGEKDTWNKWIKRRTYSSMNIDDDGEIILPRKSINDDITDTTYIEMVSQSPNTMQIVQLRDGPSLPGTVNYIPRPTKVSVIYRPDHVDNNLLAWEKLLKGNKDKGVVVVLKEGSSLASHWAVHAIQLGIPVITDGRSIVSGDVLQPEGEVIPKLKIKALRDLKSKMSRLEQEDFLCLKHDDSGNYKTCSIPFAITTAFGTVHNMAQWDDSPLHQKLRAHALVTLPRVIMAACAGEMRHFVRICGYSRVSEMKTKLPIVLEAMGLKNKPKDREDGGYLREDVYIETIKPMRLKEISIHLKNMGEDFDARYWGARPSYGGPNWQRVAQGGHRLCEALLAFKRRPGIGAWREVVLAANNAIHQVHNGGKVLNKWLSDTTMTAIANNPAIGFMNTFAGKMILGEDEGVA